VRFPSLLVLLVLGPGCNLGAGYEPDCGTFAPITNEAGCPETFDAAILYTPCSAPGLACHYPEKEYGTSAYTCNGPLLLSCGGNGGDASVGEWGTPLP
jgi:hypothetical protein